MTSPSPHVAVHGTAHRDVTPDRFEATVRVVCRAAEATVAAAALIAGFDRVEAAIEALPVELDVTARRSGVSQRRVVWPDQPPAWIASRSATLTSGAIEQAGAIIGPFADLIGAVDGIELDGPTWHLDRDNSVHGELQAEAVHAALIRARRYAAALGATLGPLIELADPGLDGYRGTPMRAMAAYGTGGEGLETMDFTPVPIEVEASVEGRWALILP
jgi:uncharacterized protein YggE